MLKNNNKSIIIIMGVSGCGKTTIGEILSERIGLPFYDADDFHPALNIEKMSTGISLNDEDRKPWLKTLANQIKVWEQESGAILSCSALKESYRQILNSNAIKVSWVYLSGTFELIKSRMENRKSHFMKAEMLQSQFKTLEIPKYGFHIDIDKSPELIVNEIIEKIDA